MIYKTAYTTKEEVKVKELDKRKLEKSKRGAWVSIHTYALMVPCLKYLGYKYSSNLPDIRSKRKTGLVTGFIVCIKLETINDEKSALPATRT